MANRLSLKISKSSQKTKNKLFKWNTFVIAWCTYLKLKLSKIFTRTKIYQWQITSKRRVCVYKIKFRYIVESILIIRCRHTLISIFISKYPMMSKQRTWKFVIKILLLITLLIIISNQKNSFDNMTIRYSNLTKISTVKFLGVTLDENLTFNSGGGCWTLSVITFVAVYGVRHLESTATYNRSSFWCKRLSYPWRNLWQVRRCLRICYDIAGGSGN